MATRKNLFDLKCLVELLLEQFDLISLMALRVASAPQLKKIIELVLKVIPLFRGLFVPL